MFWYRIFISPKSLDDAVWTIYENKRIPHLPSGAVDGGTAIEVRELNETLKRSADITVRSV